MSKKERESQDCKSGEIHKILNFETEQDRTGCHFWIPQSTHRRSSASYSWQGDLGLRSPSQRLCVWDSRQTQKSSQRYEHFDIHVLAGWRSCIKIKIGSSEANLGKAGSTLLVK